VAIIQNALIYLFGFSGTGKLSIARELQTLVPCTIVDNHLINNVVLSLIDADGKSPLLPLVWEHIARIRAVVFDTIRTLSGSQRNFIFTNELIEGVEVARRVFAQVAEVASSRNAKFLPVRLLITPEELARRVASPGRAALHKGTDAAAAFRKAREQVVLIETHDIGTLLRAAGRGESCIRPAGCGLPVGDHKDRPYIVCQSFVV